MANPNGQSVLSFGYTSPFVNNRTPPIATRFTIPPRTFPTFPVLTYLDGSLLAK